MKIDFGCSFKTLDGSLEGSLEGSIKESLEGDSGGDFRALLEASSLGLFCGRGEAFAAFLVLEGENGEMLLRKTSLLGVSRGAGGRVSATYRVVLLENELEGLCIRRVGFSPVEDVGRVRFFAELNSENACKRLGHALILTITVRARLNLVDALFLGENNPLANFLVGAAPLEGDFSLAPAYLNAMVEALGEGSAGGVVAEDFENGFRLVGEGVAVGAEGIDVLLGGVAVLRLPAVVKGVARVDLVRASEAGLVRVGGSLARVLETACEGEQMCEPKIIRQPVATAWYRDCLIKLSGDGRFVCSAGGKFFAFVGEKDVLLFGASMDATGDGSLYSLNAETSNLPLGRSFAADGELVLLRMLCRMGEQVAVLEDGTVVFFGEKICVCGMDGSLREFEISGNGRAAACGAIDRIFVAVENGGFVFRYEILGENARLLGMSPCGTGLCLFAQERSIAAVDGTEIFVGGMDFVDAVAERFGARVVLSLGKNAVFAGDGRLLLAKSENGAMTLACDLLSGTTVAVSPETRLCGGALLVPSENGWTVCVLDCEGLGLRELLCVDSDVSDVAVCGNLIVTKSVQGKLKIARLCYGDTYAFCRDFAGKTVSVKAAEDMRVESPASLTVYFEF